MRPGVIVLICLVVAAALVWLLNSRWRAARRRRLANQPPSPEQISLLTAEYPLYSRLPSELRDRLHGRINVFLDEKRFVGCDGVVVTDQMCMLIAAQACLLVVNRPESRYKHLQTIYIYPAGYTTREVRQDGHIVSDRASHRLGESWTRGPMVLSWADAYAGAKNSVDGHNVVYHEFAHRLDAHSGAVDGAPLLGEQATALNWARVIRPIFDRHKAATARGEATFFDAYGATAPEEFFAVAVEAFFERASAFREHEPDLYGVMASYFRLHPHEWR